MSFQIRKEDNTPVLLNDLDAEAAEFWGKEVDEKEYANPYVIPSGLSFSERMSYSWTQSNNWFDFIGWAIHNSKATNWNMVRSNLHFIFSGKLDCKVVKPHMELIEHWEKKGYKPFYTK